MTSTAKARLGATVFMLAATLAPAHGQSAGDPIGEQVDPVSGYPCITPFCDTVRIPRTDCLCQKQNPAEQRLENLRFTCTDMSTRQQCSFSPR